MRGQQFLVVLERQPLERDMFNELAGLRLTGEDHELANERRDYLGGGHVLARSGHVIQLAVAAEEPFARGVEGGLEVLQLEARIDGPAGIALELLTDGDELACSRGRRR